MATVTPTITYPGAGDGSVILYTWLLTTANPDGAPIQGPEWADRTWTAAGTWGGATLVAQGGNDGATWMALSNASGGADVAATANDVFSTVELPLFVRPNLTVVGAAAAVTVTLLARRATPMRT